MAFSSNIAPDWKLPGTNIDVDASLAGTPTSLKFALLVGHKNNAGTAPGNFPVAVASQADADALFGAGSMLARMFKRFFAINRSQVLYCAPVPEVAAGTAASGAVTVASAPSASGVLSLYVAGQRVPVSIGQTDTTAQVATKIANAIAATTDLPVTASVASAVVTLTAKWKGLTGNDIRVEDSILGLNGGEALPAGLAITYPTNNVLASGTGTPDLTTLIANMGDQPWFFVGLPFVDTASQVAFGGEFGFSDSGRWGWIRQMYGQVWGAIRDTYANLMTRGPTENFPVIHNVAVEPASPTPIWEWVAAFTAQAARGFTADPARPLQTLTFDGVLPAPAALRFNLTQLNALAKAGWAIQGTNLNGANDNVPIILREQSRYQKNSQGQADNAYELATTLSTLAEIFTRKRQRISSRYPRHKLANDGTKFGAGQAIVTPKLIKAELIAEYSEMVRDGLVENLPAFKDNLVVQRSSTDPNTIEVVYPPDLINQLRRLNIKAQFRLQFAA